MVVAPPYRSPIFVCYQQDERTFVVSWYRIFGLEITSQKQRSFSCILLYNAVSGFVVESV
jgi:hypothetical protein